MKIEPEFPFSTWEKPSGSAGIRCAVVDGASECFRVMLNHPELAAAAGNLLATLLYKANKLDLRLRELIIMRVAWRTGSVYEWTQHWRVAERLEIDAESMLAVRDWRAADCLRRHRSCGPRRNGRDFGRGPDFGRDLDRMLHLSRNRSRTD